MLLDRLSEVEERIRSFVHFTPVLTSGSLNEMIGADLLFKCENFQRAGSFKIRGAMNAALQLSEEERTQGFITHSSGNFAQALALAGKELGVPVTIIMPRNSPEVKKSAVRSYGGIIHECEPTQHDREAMTRSIQQKNGATFLHPYNMDNIILGQATCAAELITQEPDLDVIYCPVGGGGLLSGTCLAAQRSAHRITIVGAEPSGADDAYRSFTYGNIQENTIVRTIADGLRTNLGDKTFPIIRQYVDRIALVKEIEIIEAMKLVWERMKMIIEPSSAVTVAAVMKDRDELSGKRVGIIISGGNVDLGNLPFGAR